MVINQDARHMRINERISRLFNERIIKFLISGGSAALLNFALIYIFIEFLGFKTYFLKNLANLLVIEICIVFVFTLSRVWTWNDAPKKQGKSLWGQYLSFNLAYLAGIVIKVILFAVFDKLGMFYIINIAIGMVVAAGFDFIFSDKFVFKRKRDKNGTGVT